jgi:hypothetical protein
MTVGEQLLHTLYLAHSSIGNQLGFYPLSSIHRQKIRDTVRGGPLNQLWPIGEYSVKKKQGYCADEAGEDAFPLFVLVSVRSHIVEAHAHSIGPQTSTHSY